MIPPNTRSVRGKGTYVSRACETCRKKKTRCDGTRPQCASCERSGDECAWDPMPRGRGGMVEQNRRIAALERMVSKLVQEKSVDTVDIFEDLSDSGSSDEEPSESDVPKEIARPTTNLTADDEGLVLHNSTSVFRFQIRSTIPSPFRIPQADPHKRYCLQVSDDQNSLPSFINPEFEFDRYLPHNLPGDIVLSRLEHDRCLDLLFKFVTPWCERIIQHIFLRDMYEALNPERPKPAVDDPLPRTAHYSPMLHNGLIALALSFSDDPQLKDQATRECFAKKAKSYIDAEAEKPSISAILGMNIIGTYHSANGDTSLGFLYSGMSTRLSQALGLNVDCSQWVKSRVITDEHMRDRIWAWWAIFCQEVCWSSFVGREVCIPSMSPRLRVPFPPVELEFDKLVWHHPSAQIPAQPNNISLTFEATCSLMTTTRRVMDSVGNLAAPLVRQVNDRLLAELDDDLQAWEDGLDPELRINEDNAQVATPHKLMLHSVRWWTTILLHRPFFHRRCKTSGPTHATICKTAAEKIMEYTAIRKRLFSLRYVPITFVQIIFSAGTVHLLMAQQASCGPQTDQVKGYLDQAALVMEYLHETGESFHCANKVAKILQDLMDEQVTPWIRRRLGESFILPVSPEDIGSGKEPPAIQAIFGGWEPESWTVSNGFPIPQDWLASPLDPFAPMGAHETQWGSPHLYRSQGGSTDPMGNNNSFTGMMNGQAMPLFQAKSTPWTSLSFPVDPTASSGDFWPFESG